MRDDDVNRSQQHNTASGDGKQQRSTAERLFDLFVGNERRHVISSGLPVFDKAKNKWSLTVTTKDEPATVDHWQQHLDHRYILSIIPLLDNGACWFGCIDVDEYDTSYVDVCDRIDRLKLPLLPCVSKSTGLHIFAFFQKPVPAELVRPALRTWATQLRLKEFEIFPTNDGTSGEFSRAIAMPYGATWNVLPEQNALNGLGNAILLDTFLSAVKKITADDLSEPQKESQRQSRKIPLYLQTAINSVGPYPDGDRSPIIASIIWQLCELGFDADAIEAAVKDRGPFTRYEEKGKSLEADIARLIAKYDERHPNKAQAPPLQIQSSAEFVGDFIPPDYLIDGLIQRRFIYSMTGPTGEGTSVALLLALLVDRGWPLDGRGIDKGKVLFFAGENPDDVRIRWSKLLEDTKVDAREVNVFFVPGSFAISDKALRDQIMQAGETNGPFALIIVDTSAAFFEGDDENVNTQMMAHAKRLRGLINLIAGEPTVIVTSHPVKNFSRENMIPRAVPF